jgi:cobalt-precorrin-5B (C1)-methyltransferase
MKKVLRHGYTTGACAAAACKGAALMLRDRRRLGEVELTLPGGEQVTFTLKGQRVGETSASCFVVKDAGDDPDVTNGAEIHGEVRFAEIPPSPRPSPACGQKRPSARRPARGEGEPRIIIEGGVGVGRVTKPGLAVPVGEWAINPVPRRMIEEAIGEVFPDPESRIPVHCLISIPNGEELAKKTLNARLGIIGGLSILGTTGIVKPISAKAWTDTIDAAIDVALASGSETVVLSTGRTSELVAQKQLGLLPPPLMGLRAEGRFFPQSGGGKGEEGILSKDLLPEESFVMMGDHVGYALRACRAKGATTVILAGQFAKLLKIACGHEQTHVSSSELDLKQLAQWLYHETRTPEIETVIKDANTAREVLETSGNDPFLVDLVCTRARDCAQRLSGGVFLKVLLAGYHGEVLYFA